MSLLPAKYYYDDATQDQWQKKKKTKKEAQESKRAKFDPSSVENADEYNNSHANAMDVKRNREKNATKVSLPKPKKEAESHSNNVTDINDKDDAVDREVNDSFQYANEAELDEQGEQESDEESDGQSESNQNDNSLEKGDELNLNGDAKMIFDDNGDELILDQTTTNHEESLRNGKRKTEKKELSEEELENKREKINKLREKLTDRINILKEKRKAPGTKGSQTKSREQIIEERKRKSELKRQEKLKKKREETEDEEPENEVDAGSESESDNEEPSSEPVIFGNIEFNYGSKVTSDLNRTRIRKHKGPANNDVKAHLLKLEQTKRKMAELPTEEQEKAMEKNQWQKAFHQAEGLKQKDNEKLLKKALKRKDKQKSKSEREWKERKNLVEETKSARQKRRDENLKARRESKGKKGSTPRLHKFTGIAKPASNKKKRAGFEGSAKSKGKQKK